MKNFTELDRKVDLNSGGPPSIFKQMFWHFVLEFNLEYSTDYIVTAATPEEYLKKFLEENKNYSIYHYNYLPSNRNRRGYRRNKWFETVLLDDTKKSIVSVQSDGYNRVNIGIAGKTKELTDCIYEKLVLAFPEKKIEPKAKKLKMDFWYMANRPTSVQREIAVPDWNEVKGNYPEQIKVEVEKLLTLNEPTDEPKLIILNGKPGCGKTFLLRTLLWEWRSWAKPDFVLDPEAMFATPSYLLQLVLDDDDVDDDLTALLEEYAENSTLMDNESEDKKWRVIILEDADNFISTTAKTENGQSMARLLNILDGLVGQGLKILFIITANEDEQKIHEAIKRPGRCLSNITFDGLSKEQALEWLEARGLNSTHLPEEKAKSVGFRSGHEAKYTLAELYQIAKDQRKITEVENALKEFESKELL